MHRFQRTLDALAGHIDTPAPVLIDVVQSNVERCRRSGERGVRRRGAATGS